jgi:phosphatidylglycerophosphate synthase
MVSVNKRLADLITWARAFLVPLLLWLGLAHGQDALPAVVVLMIADWTGDCFDGVLARRGPQLVHTWIGDHDLEIDMAISGALLAYLSAAGLIAYPVAILYLLLWLLLFWRKGLTRSMGMLFQAPIYGWFIFIVIRDATPYGLLLVAWIAAAVFLTWPRFPKVIVPGFLAGIRATLQKYRDGGADP